MVGLHADFLLRKSTRGDMATAVYYNSYGNLDVVVSERDCAHMACGDLTTNA